MGLLKSAALTSLVTVLLAVASIAHAYTVDTTNYVFTNSPYDEPAYQIAQKAMDDIFKKFKDTDPNPGIAIAEINLNSDESSLEIIAYPMEAEEQFGDYCHDDELALCPFYILEPRIDTVKTLAVIYSTDLSRGEDIKNGYWTLRAYNKGPKDPKYFDTYIYDPKKDGYVPEPKTE